MSKKSPGIERFLNEVSISFFGVGRDQDVCPFCYREVRGPRDFRDDLSWREYQISRLCQECQDELFEE